jgi:para-nitrobenzyl esterase
MRNVERLQEVCICFRTFTLASLACAFVLGGSTAWADQSPIVQTNTGPVQGFVESGIAKFFGIPFAAPPVGNLRWMPPVKHAPWTGVLQATAYGPTCAQITTLGVFAGPINNNEDCLYLNVFAPVNAINANPNGKKALPVFVWIYGGGAVDGESNDYDGSKLASSNTVVVTVNYRLNLFGYLAHPALDNEGHPFGNYGILDNIFALQWVKQNIANFGGDPTNVTAGGQSAGAREASSLVLSPLAAGLLHRAIFESGAMPIETPLNIAEKRGIAFAIAAGCGSGTDPSVAVCLRALPAASVEALAGNGIKSVYADMGDTGSSAYLAGTLTDGQILPLPAIQQFETGNFNHMPIFAGDVENEYNFQLASRVYYESPRVPLAETDFVTSINATFSGNAGPGGSPPAYPPGTAASVLAQYPLSNYPTPQLQWGQEGTDQTYSCFNRHVLQTLAPQVPVYTYEFRDQTAPVYFPPLPEFTFLAYHTSDIQYLFPLYHGGLGTPQPLNGKQSHLSDQLVAAWTNFAATGNPNGPGVNTTAPRYTGSNGSWLTENLTPPGLSTETDAQFSAEHKCAFWDTVLVYAPQ